MEDEARLTKNDFYRLMRDIRNIRTFAVNLNNILQATPSRLAIAAPPGMITMRNAVKNLLAAINAIKEVNNVALTQSGVAEQLAENSMVPVLFSAGKLRATAMDLVYDIKEANERLDQFHAQLIPLFVFTMSVCPVVDIMVRQSESAERQLTELKKRLNWLSEQEVIDGLPAKIEARLSELRPSLTKLELELVDISQALANFTSRMDQFSILNAKLEPLVRMAAAMDTALNALTPVMAMLKQLSKIFEGLKAKPNGQTLQEYLAETFTKAGVPEDVMMQLRFRLVRQVDHYIQPVLNPLEDLGRHIASDLPEPALLNRMESEVTAYQTRFSRVYKELDVLCSDFEQVFKDAKALTNAA